MRYVTLLALLLLAGCGYFSKKGPEFSCPQTGFIPFSRSLALTADKGALIAAADIKSFDGDCSLSKDKTTVKLDLNLSLAARRGPAGQNAADMALPYFIAVLSPDEQVLQRQAFSARLAFGEDGLGKEIEEHEIRIPVADPATAYKYKVVMGFALTPEQFKYNKEH